MPGFPPETLAFLADLRAGRDRDWFAANRHRYASDWLAPAVAFVADAAPALRTLAPDVRADPRVGGSIFRIRRDARFAPPTGIYKDYLDLWFWEGERADAASGFYLRLSPDGVDVGVGNHALTGDRLARYRKRVLDRTAGDALIAAVDEVERGGWQLTGEQLRRGPRGLTTEDPARARLLRHRALRTRRPEPHPGVLGNARFVAWCVRRWERQLPLHRWLVDVLG